MLAYGLAAGVFATSVAFGIIGISLLLGPWANMLVPPLGFVLVLLCVASRPRLTKAPYYLLSRAEFPAIFRRPKLLECVSKSLSETLTQRTPASIRRRASSSFRGALPSSLV